MAGAGEEWLRKDVHHANELRDLKQIKEWMDAKGHWSGSGRHVAHTEITKGKIHANANPEDFLGTGAYGFVQRVTYRSVTLAQKRIRFNPRRPVDILREETNIMAKLAHRHIVVMIGTYTNRDHFTILTYPVAACNLNEFLADIDLVQSRGKNDSTDVPHTFEALGFRDAALSSKEPSVSLVRPLHFLQNILGCVTEAVAYVHAQKIRHRDLKPSNILLSPGRVYLADFGISRDLKDAPNSLTEGRAVGTLSYQAPEVAEEEDHHLTPADIFSLGCVFLAAATVLYGISLERFQKTMGNRNQAKRIANLASFLEELRHSARRAGHSSGDGFTCMPRHTIGLIESMLSHDPVKRPIATDIGKHLLEIGGIDQIYLGPCCKKGSLEVSRIIETNVKAIEGEKTRLAQRVQELEQERLIDKETIKNYRSRMENEQIHVDTQYKILLKKREKDIEKLEQEIAMLRTPRQPRQAKGRPPDNPENPKFLSQNSRRLSRVPLPVRPSTPLKPASTRDISSAESTLNNSISSAWSKTTLETSTASLASRESVRSASPASPVDMKGERPEATVNPTTPSLLSRRRLGGAGKPTWAQLVKQPSSQLPESTRGVLQKVKS